MDITRKDKLATAINKTLGLSISLGLLIDRTRAKPNAVELEMARNEAARTG